MTAFARRGLLAPALVVCGLLIGAPAMPASALPETSLTIHVQDPLGEPLAQVDVTVEDASGEDTLWLGSTDGAGNLSASRSVDGERLRGGDYSVQLVDWDPSRWENHTRFAPKTVAAALVAGQDNDAGTAVMDPGALIIGTVTAPSGRPVSNLSLSDDLDELSSSIRTDRRGQYLIDAVPVGIYDFYAFLGDDDVTETIATAKVSTPGQEVRADVKKLKVRCSSTLRVSSPARGRAKVTIRSTAKSHGLTKPGGTVVLKRNGKVIRNIAWKGSSWTTTLENQTRGKKLTFKAVHTGGDCLKWFTTKTVTVKK